MKRARTPDDLAADPIDHYWLGETQLVWCRDARTCGAVHWGQPRERDVDELTRALELASHPALARGFDVFMDCRAIEQVDWAAFARLLDYVRGRLGAWATLIRRQAALVMPGPHGAQLAGLVPLVGMTYPLRFFDEQAAALDWLEWTARHDAMDAVDAVAEHVRVARGITPLVHRFRAWLAGALPRPTVEAAASALGLSPRSLQRELQVGGTSFTAEVQGARVRAASELLAQSDEKVEVIAREVGCASASQLSAIFRRVVGETPANFRARHRGKAAH